MNLYRSERMFFSGGASNCIVRGLTIGEGKPVFGWGLNALQSRLEGGV